MKKNFFVISLVLFSMFESLSAMENNSQILAHLKENIQNLPNKTNFLMMLENRNSIVSFLQEKGVDIGIINDCGIELLRIAMNDGSLEKILYFMDNIILQDSIKCINALDIADVNRPDRNQKTLLMHAIKVNNEEIVTILLKQGASIQICDTKQRNVLHYTANKNPLLIKTVLKNFITPDLNAESNAIEQKINYLKREILSHKDSYGQKPYENVNLSNNSEMQKLLNPKNTKALEAILK